MIPTTPARPLTSDELIEQLRKDFAGLKEEVAAQRLNTEALAYWLRAAPELRQAAQDRAAVIESCILSSIHEEAADEPTETLSPTNEEVAL